MARAVAGEHRGLNRTSVGLKPISSLDPESNEVGLNRTSVGLKRDHPGDRRGGAANRLNRTSVGLKPAVPHPYA